MEVVYHTHAESFWTGGGFGGVGLPVKNKSLLKGNIL